MGVQREAVADRKTTPPLPPPTPRRAAKEALNDARTVVGKCLNAAEPVNEKNDYAPGEIVFTGGGGGQPRDPRLYARSLFKRPKISSPPRSSIMRCFTPCEGSRRKATRVTYLNVDKEGRGDLEQLKAELSEDTALVSVMAANNEIGTIQPIKQIAGAGAFGWRKVPHRRGSGCRPYAQYRRAGDGHRHAVPVRS